MMSRWRFVAAEIIAGRRNDPIITATVPMRILLACLYLVGVKIRNTAFDAGIIKQRRLPLPTISIGNLAWGGTGKTPLVQKIAKTFSKQGYLPIVLMRGYGQDEDRQLRMRLPYAALGVGKDRYESGTQLITRLNENRSCEERKLGIALLDDGFQHRQLSRDLDIVLLNALQAPGLRLIPHGILREPFDSLCRADVIAVHNHDLVSQRELEGLLEQVYQHKRADAIVALTRMTLTHAVEIQSKYFCSGVDAVQTRMPFKESDDSRDGFPLDKIKRRAIVAISGIGSPEGFERSLLILEPTELIHMKYGDHHKFTDNDVNDIKEAYSRLLSMVRGSGQGQRRLHNKSQIDTSHKDESPIVVMTEKDAHRSAPLLSRGLRGLPVYAICGSLEITKGEKELLDRFSLLITSFRRQS